MISISHAGQLSKSDGSGWLMFPIWKPAPGNDDPSRVRIKESNANLADRMQFG